VNGRAASVDGWVNSQCTFCAPLYGEQTVEVAQRCVHIRESGRYCRRARCRLGRQDQSRVGKSTDDFDSYRTQRMDGASSQRGEGKAVLLLRLLLRLLLLRLLLLLLLTSI
jgi:hypothetical protein